MMKISIDKSIYFNPVNKKDSSIVRSEKIIQGIFFLFPGLDEIKFPESIDWNYVHTDNINTIALYLNSLSVVGHLLNTWIETKDRKFLNEAMNLALNWINFDKKSNRKWKRWTDHATADRVIHFVNLAFELNACGEEVPNELIDSIYSSLDFLFSDENYHESNHGLMVDRAIAYCAFALHSAPKREIWLLKAWSRASLGIMRDFSFKGTHLENSTEYHGFVKKMVSNINQLFIKIGMPFPKEVSRRLEKAEDYFGYVMMPNHELPAIGDSSMHKFPNIEKKFDNFVDIDASIAILQFKNESVPQKSTWLSFVSGCHTITHKHCDDLSFNYYTDGAALFIDSGKYNYDKNDDKRKFAISPLAHNTISIDGKSYLISPHMEKTNISSYEFGKFYSTVKGVNLSYSGCHIERKLVLFLGGDILIIDRIKSDTPQNYVQSFCIAPGAKAIFQDGIVSINNNGTQFEIEQVQDFDNVQIIEDGGFFSPKFNVAIPSNRLQFSIKSSESIFITLIRKAGRCFTAKLEENFVSVQVENNNYLIPL